MNHPIRTIWTENRAAINGWLNIDSGLSAELMAAQNYDALTLDIQHGAFDYAQALNMLQAMNGSGPFLMARVPWRDPSWIMKLLDAGVMGLICPMVNTAAEAAEFVSYLRYPPEGQRSWGPTRAALAYPDYTKERANRHVLAFAMIETAEALENVEAIAATPHLDALYIGPSDLSLGVSNGRLAPGLDREEPEMIEALQHILAAADAHNIRAAIHCGTPSYAARAVSWGFDMVTIGTDSVILAEGAAATLAETRALME